MNPNIETIMQDLPKSSIYARKARDLSKEEVDSINNYCITGTNGQPFRGVFMWDLEAHEIGRKAFYFIKQNILKFIYIHHLNARIELPLSWLSQTARTIPALTDENGLIIEPAKNILNSEISDYYENANFCLVRITDQNIESLTPLIEAGEYPTNIYVNDSEKLKEYQPEEEII